MQVEGDNYRVTYDPGTAEVVFSGFLNMRGMDGYKTIADMLDLIVSQTQLPEKILLDLRSLEFLNSTGIRVLGEFIIKLRQKGGVRLLIKCAEDHTWQAKSVKMLKNLMPKGMDIRF